MEPGERLQGGVVRDPVLDVLDDRVDGTIDPSGRKAAGGAGGSWTITGRQNWSAPPAREWTR
ncbi:MAG: hypothetical protein ACP5C4_08135 [Methanomicrobiales archaeon]